MRSISLVFVMTIFVAGVATAQQPAPKAKAAKAVNKCTYEACVARGISRGFSSSTAGERLKKHGFKDETEAGITMKLKRGTFSATFFLACLAAMELEGVVLEEI
jgi:hypothetical protein